MRNEIEKEIENIKENCYEYMHEDRVTVEFTVLRDSMRSIAKQTAERCREIAKEHMFGKSQSALDAITQFIKELE